MVRTLQQTDPQLYALIQEETQRQKDFLAMIPSENYASTAVREAIGSVLTNKYAEGFPGRRYYQGNKIIDQVENLAADRLKEIFGVPYANVQPLSGSPANSAVYMALLQNGQKLMGLALDQGGHITHGFEKIGFSGRFFKAAHYHVSPETRQLDYALVEKEVMAEKPDLLICGFTAYSRIVDWAKFREIADKAGCWLLADVSHIVGLIVGGVHPSPVPYADIITSTTHKTLRGPRGAFILVTDRGFQRDPDLGKKINTAIIPGLQGGPHENQIGALAVCLKEAMEPAFKEYAAQIIKNAKALSEALTAHGLAVVSGGTDNHLVLVDLQKQQISGKIAAEALEIAGVVLNCNLVPYDPMPPLYTSGIRMGTPAITTRGMKEQEMVQIADWISQVIDEVKGYTLPTDKEQRKELLKKFRIEIAKNQKLLSIQEAVKKLCNQFPLP